MPLILKAAGQRIYLRSSSGQAVPQLYGVQGWSYIKDRAEAADLFTFGHPEPCFINGGRYIPSIRDEIILYKSELDYDVDRRWFGGIITNVEDTIIQKGTKYIAGYRIEASAFDVLLDREIRQPQKAGMTWAQLLSFLLETHFQGFISQDFSQIQNNIPAPPIRINNGSIRTLLGAMRSLTGYDYYVDDYRRLNVFLAVNQPGSFQLSDNPASGITVWSDRPKYSHEGRAVYNVVRQPFQSQVGLYDWDGETFTGKGDPKGSGGQLALLRTPTEIEETTYLDERFDGPFEVLWQESDVNTTQHPDYPNQGYLFVANGQCQIVGGTGSLGGVALVTSQFLEKVENAYLVQEFQLTNATGDGYIAVFATGTGLNLSDFKAGLRVQNGALKALDGTTLVASLGTTANYIFWVTITPTGFQYDILGGAYATKQTIRTEAFTHATDYRIAPIVNVNLKGSINSVRYRRSDRGVLLTINDMQKVVGLEASDTDLPDIDAYLNTDETPALLKFRAAKDIAVIASVASATVFNVANGQGTKLAPGQRLLIGDNIIEEFNGRAAVVASVSTDTVTLVSPGLTGLTTGQQVLIDTTVPAVGDKIVVRYAFAVGDEATAYDSDSFQKYGPLPITLEVKDHIRRFDDAQAEAENYLSRYSDGILKIDFLSNDALIPVEPDSLTAIQVSLTKRPNPIQKNLICQRVEITPNGGRDVKYSITLESADPVQPLDDLVRNRNLVIGTDGEIRFTLNLNDSEVSDSELTIQRVDGDYITWANPAKRKWGEFRWKSDNDIPTPPSTDAGQPVGGLLVSITKSGATVTPPPVNPQGGQAVGLLMAITKPTTPK